MIDTIAEFQERGEFEKSLDALFVVIIPKRERALSMKYYRPISLVGNIYKIISKVLSIRLRKVIGKKSPLWKVDKFWMRP